MKRTLKMFLAVALVAAATFGINGAAGAMVTDGGVAESDGAIELTGAETARGETQARQAEQRAAQKNCNKIKNKKKKQNCKKKKKQQKPKRIEREVEFEYSCPCGPRVAGQGTGWQLGSATGENIGGGPISVGLDDVFLHGEVTDSSGQPVQVTINQDTNGDGFNNYVGDFCGSTGDEPIEIVPALEVRVFISAGTCNDASGPSVPTQGTILFTFSNLP